jgi:DNA-binding MarR family transcriptional regulator
MAKPTTGPGRKSLAAKPKKKGGPPLEARIGYLLAKLGRRQSLRFAELLRPLGLRPKHFALMNAVALADGPSQQQLGAALGLDPSGLITAIDELEDAGLLERRRAEEDRRRHALFLTGAGEAKLADARGAALRRGEELIAPLSRAEAERLHDLLRRVANAGQVDLRPGADWS